MSSQWSVWIHATHLLLAWGILIKWGDFQDQKLIFALTIYSACGYFIVGNAQNPVFWFSICQYLMGFIFLWKSIRWSGNLSGVALSLAGFVGSLSLHGLFPNDLWQGMSLNYWNFASWMVHSAIAMSYGFLLLRMMLNNVRDSHR